MVGFRRVLNICFSHFFTLYIPSLVMLSGAWLSARLPRRAAATSPLACRLPLLCATQALGYTRFGCTVSRNSIHARHLVRSLSDATSPSAGTTPTAAPSASSTPFTSTAPPPRPEDTTHFGFQTVPATDKSRLVGTVRMLRDNAVRLCNPLVYSLFPRVYFSRCHRL